MIAPATPKCNGRLEHFQAGDWILSTLSSDPLEVHHVKRNCYDPTSHSLCVRVPQDIPVPIGRVLRTEPESRLKHVYLKDGEFLGPAEKPDVVLSEPEPEPRFDDEPLPEERWEIWRTLFRLGFNLVPADSKKKYLTTWRQWQTERQDEDHFDFLYEQYRESPDFAIVTGQRPDDPNHLGVVVVDGDDKEALQVVQDRCPETSATTPTRRGRHHYYRHPGGVRIQSLNGVRLGGKVYKIDIKADGAVVHAPGSTNKTWDAPFTREQFESLPVYDPGWLPHEAPDWSPTGDYSTVVDSSEHQEWVDRCEVRDEVRKRRATRYLKKTPGTTVGDGAVRRLLLAHPQDRVGLPPDRRGRDRSPL